MQCSHWLEQCTIDHPQFGRVPWVCPSVGRHHLVFHPHSVYISSAWPYLFLPDELEAYVDHIIFCGDFIYSKKMILNWKSSKPVELRLVSLIQNSALAFPTHSVWEEIKIYSSEVRDLHNLKAGMSEHTSSVKGEPHRRLIFTIYWGLSCFAVVLSSSLLPVLLHS